MSYDIQFGVKVEGTDIIATIDMPEYDNPTYNLREMFVACMDWDYTQGEWYRCIDVIPKFERGVFELTYKGEEYKKYDSPNGWGTVSDALKALKSVVQKAKEITGGFSWNEIPMEHLWIRW